VHSSCTVANLHRRSKCSSVDQNVCLQGGPTTIGGLRSAWKTWRQFIQRKAKMRKLRRSLVSINGIRSSDDSTGITPKIKIFLLNLLLLWFPHQSKFPALNVFWFRQVLDFPPWSSPSFCVSALCLNRPPGGLSCGTTLLCSQYYLYSRQRFCSFHPSRGHKTLLCPQVLCFAAP
jgi:hypothetical protein